MKSKPTLESLGKIVQEAKVLTRRLEACLFPNGKPDYMKVE